MVKVVEGGQCSAIRARFSPGVRTGWHLVAAEATDTPRPITIETAKTTKSLLKIPLLTSLSPRCSVCPMIGAHALTHKLNSFTRKYSKDNRSQPGRLRVVGPGLCGRGLPRNPNMRTSVGPLSDG